MAGLRRCFPPPLDVFADEARRNPDLRFTLEGALEWEQAVPGRKLVGARIPVATHSGWIRIPCLGLDAGGRPVALVGSVRPWRSAQVDALLTWTSKLRANRAYRHVPITLLGEGPRLPEAEEVVSCEPASLVGVLGHTLIDPRNAKHNADVLRRVWAALFGESLTLDVAGLAALEAAWSRRIGALPNECTLLPDLIVLVGSFLGQVMLRAGEWTWSESGSRIRDLRRHQALPLYNAYCFLRGERGLLEGVQAPLRCAG